MNRMICMQHAKRLAFGLAALALVAAPSFAQTTIDLCASDGTVTMPDGAMVPIWGYADITGGGACVTGLATLPGPVLAAADGELLTVNLSNALNVPVSIFIPGLAKPLVAQFMPDGQGRERLTSFDVTVGPSETGSYSWTATEGTYLYHSGTDVRTQVPMGFYGAVVVTGTGYPAVDHEVLVFSEIDPNLNTNPGGFGGARVSTWSPQYFLINGAAYPNTMDININVSENVLLRFVNAGIETFVPTLGGGLYMDVIAEDGNLYPYPLTQYGIELPAGKTMDAVINAGSPGTYALYDRALHLTNGGMLVNIQASAADGAPTAVNDAYLVAEDGMLTADGEDLNPAGVLDNDTGGATNAVLVTGPSAGTLVDGLAADGTFIYTPNANLYGADQFTYVANDGAGGPNSNVATVTITVTPVNDPPVALADAYEATESQTLSVAAPGVLANDIEVDGDTLTVTIPPESPPTNGNLTLNPDGSLEYTPLVAAPNSDSFTYETCDAEQLCSTATVTITVVGPAANIAPTAIDDTAQVQGYKGNSTPTSVNINIVENDEDPDGTINPASVVITTGTTTQRGGTVVNIGGGTVTFTPKKGFRGTDTFQYTVNDDDGATSNIATVRINVL